MPEHMLISLLVIASGIAVSLVAVIIFLVGRTKKLMLSKKDVENRVQQIEGQFNALQLETLEAKLNPHLFKNILNSIQSHAYQTYFALDKLGNVLDYILYESRKKFVTPEEEIAFAQSLIEINKIKVSPLFELKVKAKINESDPLYKQRILAPMIAIDLIENAFKHADIQSPNAFISIVFEFMEGRLQLTVSNKISPKKSLEKQNSGIGFRTLEQRLRIIYNSHYVLERFVEEDIHIAYLKINLVEYKAQMHTA